MILKKYILKVTWKLKLLEIITVISFVFTWGLKGEGEQIQSTVSKMFKALPESYYIYV